MARASEENQGPSEADEADQESSQGPGWSSHIEFLRGLASIVRDEELSELSVEQAGVRLSLRSRRPSIVPPEPAPALPALALPLASLGVDATVADSDAGEGAAHVLEPREEEASGTPIVSPMVGVFFRSKTPEDPPFVQLGDRIEVGQVIGLVEAMKTFNEIQSEIEGEVVAIAARNGEEVQAGAPLVVVR